MMDFVLSCCKEFSCQSSGGVHTNVRCGLSRRENRSRPRLVEQPVASVSAVGISCARRSRQTKAERCGQTLYISSTHGEKTSSPGGAGRTTWPHFLPWINRIYGVQINYATSWCTQTARADRDVDPKQPLYARTAVLGVFTTASFSRQINICLLVHHGRKPARFLP